MVFGLFESPVDRAAEKLRKAIGDRLQRLPAIYQYYGNVRGTGTYLAAEPDRVYVAPDLANYADAAPQAIERVVGELSGRPGIVVQPSCDYAPGYPAYIIILRA